MVSGANWGRRCLGARSPGPGAFAVFTGNSMGMCVPFDPRYVTETSQLLPNDLSIPKFHDCTYGVRLRRFGPNPGAYGGVVGETNGGEMRGPQSGGGAGLARAGGFTVRLQVPPPHPPHPPVSTSSSILPSL